MFSDNAAWRRTPQMTSDAERPRKRGLLAALAAMTPLEEDFAEIADLPAEPVDPFFDWEPPEPSPK